MTWQSCLSSSYFPNNPGCWKKLVRFTETKMPHVKWKIKIHPLSFLLRFVANWKIMVTSCYHIYTRGTLQCDFAASSIKRWSLFLGLATWLALANGILASMTKAETQKGFAYWMLLFGWSLESGDCQAENPRLPSREWEITQGRELGCIAIYFSQMTIMKRGETREFRAYHRSDYNKRQWH